MAVVDYYMDIQVGDNVVLKVTRYKPVVSNDDSLIEYHLYGSGYIYDDIAYRLVSTSIPAGEEDYFCKVTYSDNRELKVTNYSKIMVYSNSLNNLRYYSVTKDYAFENLVIPDGIKNIPGGLFGSLSNLYRNIYIGKDVEQLGTLWEDSMNYHNKYIEINRKYNTGNNVHAEVFNLFAGESINISENNKVLKTIGNEAFYNFSDDLLAHGVDPLVKSKFYKISKIDFRRLPNFIDDRAFSQASVFTELNLGTLDHVGSSAFSYCTNLTKFNSENKINGIIYSQAFEFCENLTMFTFTDNASFEYLMQSHFSVRTHKSNNIETTINTNNEIFLDYNWDNDGRIVKTSTNTKVIYVAYNNKWIQLSVYKTGDIPVALDDVYCYLKLVELNDKNASPIKVNTPTGFKALSY